MSSKKKISVLKIESKETDVSDSQKTIVKKSTKSISGHLYLLQEREFIKSDENVFKIGKSADITTRCMHYPKGSHIIIVMECDDITVCENKLKSILDEKFKNRSDIGREYYEGDKDLIKLEFINAIFGIDSCGTNQDEDDQSETESDPGKCCKVEYNNNTSTLSKILPEPIEIFDPMFISSSLSSSKKTVMTIIKEDLPDWFSIPVIEKVHKSAKKLVSQIQKIILSYYDLTYDGLYKVPYSEFHHFLLELPEYKEYDRDCEIIDMVIAKLSDYNILHDSTESRTYIGLEPNALITTIPGLKIKNYFIHSLQWRSVTYMNANSSNKALIDFESEYKCKLTRGGINIIEKSNPINLPKVIQVAKFMLEMMLYTQQIGDRKNSYVFKHIIERDAKNRKPVVEFMNEGSYVSNGEAILACFMLGCNIKYDKSMGPNCTINIGFDLNHPLLLQNRTRYWNCRKIHMIQQ